MNPQRGAAAEYALLATLIAIVIIGGLIAFGGQVAELFDISW